MTPDPHAALAALQRILAKCEQYWNEPNIHDAEAHAMLECIHRDTREALGALPERAAGADVLTRVRKFLVTAATGALATYSSGEVELAARELLSALAAASRGGAGTDVLQQLAVRLGWAADFAPCDVESLAVYIEELRAIGVEAASRGPDREAGAGRSEAGAWVQDVLGRLVDAAEGAHGIVVEKYPMGSVATDLQIALLKARQLREHWQDSRGGAPESVHPEAVCERCGGPNVVWFAPNELWNRVLPDSGGILCPICFVRAAEAAGIRPSAWQLTEEALPGNVLKSYPATDACATTGAPRFHRICACRTYAGNWGACATWEPGSNGRCAYCDHEKGCHRGGAGTEPAEPPPVGIHDNPPSDAQRLATIRKIQALERGGGAGGGP